jgi:hypothetical protein
MTKPAGEFYVSRGRLSSYCRTCQRRVSGDAYRRRRQDAAERERMRQVDRARKRAERARLARVDPDRERRAGQARTAAVRRLITAHQPEYRALLAAERTRRAAAHAARRWRTVPDEGFYRAGRSRPGPRVHGGHSGPSGSRRARWDSDAGITERDVAALGWLGQQYAARSDVLRVLLGRLSPGSPRVAGHSARRPCGRSLTAGTSAA